MARVTVRQAIDILREEGLLHCQQGRGTFVAAKPLSTMHAVHTAIAQASSQYGGAYINNGYGNRQGGYGYNQGYGNGYNSTAMRITSISDVQRRQNGLRVSGTMKVGGGDAA